MLVVCTFRPEDKMLELTVNTTYNIISIEKSEILIANNVNRVQWYPLHYFKFIWKTEGEIGTPITT